MKQFKVQGVDEAGNVKSNALNDDILLEELATRGGGLDKVEMAWDRDATVEGPFVPIAEASAGTVIILPKGGSPVAEYVTEIYPGKAGAEPWKGAGTGFYAGGNYYRTSDEGRSWRSLRLKAGQPVEVDGKGVRTLPLPNDAPAPAEAMAAPLLVGQREWVDGNGVVRTERTILAEEEVEIEVPDPPATFREMADKLGDLPTGQLAVPGLQEPKKPEPRPTLDVAIERYQNLDEGVQRFLVRLDSWVVIGALGSQDTHDALVDQVACAWAALGNHLRCLVKEGATVKVTNRSRRDAWMRPGAEVSLREDVEKRFGAVYTADVLENLVIRAATENDVFLVSGEREIGLVPKAQIRKRTNNKKGE